MELRHLRYFAAAAKAEHFGRAAKQLAVAQPALSRRIADLERELGVALFERLPRGVKLSQAGISFFERIAPAIDIIDKAVTDARLKEGSFRGQVNLGFNEIAAHNWNISAALQGFRMRLPSVRVNLLTLSSIAQLRALKEKSIDAAIVYDFHIEPGEADKLRRQTLNRGTIMLAAQRSHRLARKKAIVAKDLNSEPVLWLRRSGAPRLQDRLMSACLEAGLVPSIVQEAATYSSLLSLVSAGMGLGFVGSEVAHMLPTDVVLRKIIDIDVELRVELLSREDEVSREADAFVHFLAEWCMEHPIKSVKGA